MSNNIGAKVELEGADEFKKSIDDVNKQFKLLGSEMKIVAAEFDRNDKSEAALTARNKVLNKEIGEHNKKVSTLEAALKKSKEQFGENSEQTNEWQIKLNNAQAALKKAERQVRENEDALKDLGNNTKDAGESMDDTSGKASTFGDVLKATLASEVIVAGVKAIARGIKELGQDLINCSVKGAAFADGIITLSAQTSVSTDKLQELQYASELVDVSVETVTKSMAKNVKSMSSAADGSKAYAEAYAQLGVSVTDANGELRDGETVYWESIDALGQISNETERDAIAMQLFGKSAQDLNPLIEAGSEQMTELADKAHEAGYVMSGDTLDAFLAFDDQLQYLKVGADAAKNAFGTVLLPSLTTLATDGNALLGDFTSALLDANGDIGKIGEAIGNTLSGVVTEIVGFLPELIEMGGEVISALGTGIITNLPMMLSASLDIVTTLGDGLAESIREIMPAIIDVVLQIVDMLTDPDTLVELLSASLAIIVAIADGLMESLPKLLEKAPEIILNLLTALYEAIPMLLSAGVELVNTIGDGLESMWQIVVGWGADIIGKAGEGIKAGFEMISETIGGWINENILTPIKSTIDEFTEIGKNIVSGIWEGISGAYEWITGKIKEWVGDVISFFKDILGIHSPSTVFMTIGEYITQGLEIGMKNRKGDLMETIKDIADEVKSRFQELINTFSLSSDISDLEYKLWEKTYGATATETEKLEKQIDSLTKRRDSLASQIEATRAAYEEIVSMYGENASESMQLEKQLLNEKIAFQELTNSINDAAFAEYELYAFGNDSKNSIANGVDPDVFNSAKEITSNTPISTVISESDAKMVKSILNAIYDTYGSVSNMQVVLDDGTLVGKITGKIDNALGSQYVLNARGALG